jgi:hypothetical protein
VQQSRRLPFTVLHIAVKTSNPTIYAANISQQNIVFACLQLCLSSSLGLFKDAFSTAVCNYIAYAASNGYGDWEWQRMREESIVAPVNVLAQYLTSGSEKNQEYLQDSKLKSGTSWIWSRSATTWRRWPVPEIGKGGSKQNYWEHYVQPGVWPSVSWVPNLVNPIPVRRSPKLETSGSQRGKL